MKYSIADDVRKIARRIISTKFIDEWEQLDVSFINTDDITFVRVDKDRTDQGLRVLAKFVKLSSREKFLGPYKYMIECTPAFDDLSLKGKIRTVHHELLHHPKEEDLEQIIPHDIVDFKIIIKKYGLETE